MSADQLMHLFAGALLGVASSHLANWAVTRFERWSTARYMRKVGKDYRDRLYYRPRAYPRRVE